jgi:hypothetical protein
VTTRPAPTVPAGLAAILRPVEEHDGPEPLDAATVAGLVGVKPETVTGWATSGRMSGLLLSRSIGWRFAKADIVAFLTKRYYTARQR